MYLKQFKYSTVLNCSHNNIQNIQIFKQPDKYDDISEQPLKVDSHFLYSKYSKYSNIHTQADNYDDISEHP